MPLLGRLVLFEPSRDKRAGKDDLREDSADLLVEVDLPLAAVLADPWRPQALGVAATVSLGFGWCTENAPLPTACCEAVVGCGLFRATVLSVKFAFAD